MRRWPRWLVVLVVLAGAGEARAECARAESSGCRDFGVWGRFDGDVELALGVGMARGVASDIDSGSGALRASAHWFATAGLVIGYEDALGGRAASAVRSLALGVDLRPAFVPRLTNDLEQGPALLDLTIDSISLGLGAFWAEPQGRSFGAARGFESSLGLGMPLLGHAPGPWIEARGRLRWVEADVDPAPEAAVVAVLSWHAFWLSPLVN
jgi:hypothetical protein